MPTSDPNLSDTTLQADLAGLRTFSGNARAVPRGVRAPVFPLWRHAHGEQAVQLLDRVGAKLAEALRRAERAEAEAALARQLLSELRVAPPRERTGGRRKASPATGC